MNLKEPYPTSCDSHLDYIRLCGLLLSLLEEPEQQAEMTARAKSLLEQIRNREQSSMVFQPFPALKELLGLDEYAYFCLYLAFCCEADGSIRNRIQDLLGCPVPTFDFAFGLYSHFLLAEHPDHLLSLADPDCSPLRFLFYMEQKSDPVPLLFTPLLLRRNVLRWLANGCPDTSRYYQVIWDAPEQFLSLHQPIFDTVVRTANENLCGFVFLTGQPGTGKKSLIRRAAAQQGVPCLFCSCEALHGLSAETQRGLSSELALDAALSGGFLCLHSYKPEYSESLYALLNNLFPSQRIFLLANTEECPAPDFGGPGILWRKTGALSQNDYQTAQNHFCMEYAVNPAEFSNYCRLTIGQLCSVWLDVWDHCQADGRKKVLPKDFSEAVRAAKAFIPLARTVKSTAVLDDLTIGPETAERLHMLRGFIQNWCTGGMPACGNGITALFYGPSGTGKTMAAGAIANELELELLKIDLSQIFDKYIGETEKHLSEVFAAARERNCILFFDEADALFSKRTEISSSHDRYANVQTSFLLQSIEDYDGVVLLATNLFKNFDEAFLRRINLLIRFSMPNEQQRLSLWKTAFPEEIALGDVDFPLLARDLELSPAVIFQIAKNAAALLTTGYPHVTAALLKSLVSNELEKTGKRLNGNEEAFIL